MFKVHQNSGSIIYAKLDTKFPFWFSFGLLNIVFYVK